MAEHAADGFDVYTVLESQGGESVSQIVESDLRDACPLQDAFQHIVDAVGRDGAAVGGWEYVLILRFGPHWIRQMTMSASTSIPTSPEVLYPTAAMPTTG